MNTNENSDNITLPKINIIKVECIGGQTKETARGFNVTLESGTISFISNVEGAKLRDEVFLWDGIIEPEFTDEKLLEDVRTKKNLEVESKRKELQYANITYNGITLFATEKARDNLFKDTIISKGLGESSLSWLDINNTPVTLSLDEANDIIMMLRQRDKDLYFKEAQLKLAIDACTSIEDAEDIQIVFD